MANIRHNLKNLLLKGKSFVSVINSSKENILNGNLDKRGWQSVSVNGGDSPAATFLSAAGITDPTITSAVYTLVNDLNSYGLWSKMKAIYPMVGGNATAHSYNLKDTTKFQIAFSGGWTHASTGATPNGTNAFGNTAFIPSSNGLAYNNNHLSFYSRTSQTGATQYYEMGSGNNAGSNNLSLFIRRNTDLAGYDSGDFLTNRLTFTNTNGQGFYCGTAPTTTSKYFKNGISQASKSLSVKSISNLNTYIGAFNEDNTVVYYSNKECAFATIGEGLSDTEAANLYTSIQKFQTTLGRYVGTPIVSDSDAQTFLNTASITDLTQANAVNTLVTDLKGANLWTKMKALYPMVGGTASSHSYNLKNPTQFQITWSGGLTHSSTGTIGNGTNGYGNTNLIPLNDLLDNSCHLSFYSRTNESAGNIWDCGVADDARSYLTMLIKNSSTEFKPLAQDFSQSAISNSDSKGFYITNRTASNISNGWKNGTKIISPNANSLTRANLKIFLLSLNYSGTGGAVFYSTKECAFATIGDGLTDTDASNLYTIIQNYQISLGRSVGPQTVSDPDAQLFINTADIQDQIQATAVNTLVTDLKSNNLWTKMKAVYPMVGGNATSHSYNLKNPLQFQITFNGGWTHSSTGALPNGSNAYANTYLSPNSQLSLNNSSISYYSRTNGFSTSIMGASNTLNDAILLAPRFASGVLDDYSAINCSTVQKSAAPNTLGLFTISRIASTNYKGYQNGTQYFNSITSSSALTTQNIYIGARNWNGSADQYGNLQCAFTSIGDGLTDTDASNLNTIIQNYQTILSRQV